MHAFARFGGERIGKLPADVVGREDVHLEEDLPLGRADRRKPRRKVLFGVEQQFDSVAFTRRRAGCAFERAIADLRERIRGGDRGRMQRHASIIAPSFRRSRDWLYHAGSSPAPKPIQEDARMRMVRYLLFAALSATSLLCAPIAAAQVTVKIGLILPMTGPFASTGRQIETAVKLYMQQHGTTVAGKKVELIVKDDGGVADATRPHAQEV